MAAESYLEGDTLSDIEKIKRALYLGANREGYNIGEDRTLNEGYPGNTRMTYSQADEFLDKFSIIHQLSDNPTYVDPKADDPVDLPRPEAEGIDGKPKLYSDILANTGLSATLIQNKITGEYTLSIRSTESRSWGEGGDAQRDKYGADALDLALSGRN